jgi:outer membrane protein assembly factor BamB
MVVRASVLVTPASERRVRLRARRLLVAGRFRRICLILAAAILGTGASPAIASAESEVSVGSIQTLAHVPYPGNPGAATIDGNTMWVDSSSANFDRPWDGYSAVFAYDLRTGQLLPRSPNPINVPKPPAAIMGLAGIALDSEGRTYIADMNGQVQRVDPTTNTSTTYATVPTSTSTSLTAMPTFDVFGPDGSLYVGDASAPVIWRVPPGGGQAQPWFVDPRLSGDYGAAVDGLAIDPSGRELYFASGPEAHISIYHLPLAQPDASHLQLLHTYDLSPELCTANAAHITDPNGPLALLGCAGTNSAGAGGIVFGKSGRLYVSLLSVSQLSILSPSGDELLRFPDPQQNMQLDNPVNGPFNLALDRFGRLLIADLGDPTAGYFPGPTPPPGPLPDSKSWAILAVQVHDTPARLFRPDLP